jgi:phosphatidylglycerol:prolipoprotein diacylglycerol transferase
MLVLASWLHDLSPFAVKFTDTFGLRWYGLSYATGFVLAYLIMWALASRRLILIPKERIGDAMTWLILGVIVGGRLGYAIFYDPSLFVSFSRDFPWWGIFALNRGGMASHGGMVGVIIACWFVSRGFRDEKGRCSMLHVMDVMAIAAPPGLFCGRIANFVNGELLGKIVAMPGEPSPWWAVKFPQEILSNPMSAGGHRPPLNPEQTRALNLLISKYALPSDNAEQSFQRVLDALQRGTSETSRRIATELAPLVSARHPSQLYQAFAEGIVLGLVLLWIWRRPRVPGVIASWFLILYGVLRITTEFWRLPDAQLAVQRIAGLSRGQWLSVFMIVAGLALLAWSMRNVGRANPPQRIGGWAKRSA